MLQISIFDEFLDDLFSDRSQRVGDLKDRCNLKLFYQSLANFHWRRQINVREGGQNTAVLRSALFELFKIVDMAPPLSRTG